MAPSYMRNSISSVRRFRENRSTGWYSLKCTTASCTMRPTPFLLCVFILRLFRPLGLGGAVYLLSFIFRSGILWRGSRVAEIPDFLFRYGHRFHGLLFALQFINDLITQVGDQKFIFVRLQDSR